MRKKIIIDRNKLKEIGYQAAPLRWVLGLTTLNPSQKNQYLNFFSHDIEWKLSNNSITKCFGRKKSGKNVRRDNQLFVELGYMTETENSFILHLDRIKEDYLKANGKNGTKNTTDPENTPSTVLEVPPPGTENTPPLIPEVPPSGIENTNQTGIDSTTNNRKISEKGKEKEINETNNPISGVKDNLSSNIDLEGNPKNSLKVLLESNEFFRELYYESQEGFYELKIDNYNDDYIAHLIVDYETNDNSEIRIDNPTFALFLFMVKASVDIDPDTKKEIPNCELGKKVLWELGQKNLSFNKVF